MLGKYVDMQDSFVNIPYNYVYKNMAKNQNADEYLKQNLIHPNTLRWTYGFVETCFGPLVQTS